ncbi:hypothetical protein SUGI_1093390 [Cryptomeria japonica]|nr:hypothetical protein SUGI_1093390 [Cryptomeria japonica]
MTFFLLIDYSRLNTFWLEDSRRYLTAGTLEESLKKVTDSIQEIRGSLTLTGVIDIKGQFSEFLPSSPKRLDFEPVGIEKQVQDVKKLLDMEGSEPAVAVILSGFGGVGKTTLASEVIYQLKLPSTAFKYCKVTINEMQEKTSIIHDLAGKKFSLRDATEGRRTINEMLGKQCCLLYIDNVVEGDYIEDLLTRDIDYEKTRLQKLRIVITSRAGNLQARLKIKEYEGYRLEVLSHEAANVILRRLILRGGNEIVASEDFDEEGLMNDVAVACQGIPLLPSVYGNHLCFNREKKKYEEARDALRKGDLNGPVKEQLEQRLLFVYHKLKDFNEEA